MTVQVPRMSLQVLYNGRCPICSAEIDHYRAYAERIGADIAFEDLNAADLPAWKLDRDGASKRLHARRGAEIFSGVDAFAQLWDAMPKYRWLARLVRLPVLGGLARFTYDRIAAPWLYKKHLKREAQVSASK